jgi:hypothetical protein
MSRVLKVSQGDYRLQVQNGGNIILDTGTNAGLVTITGNLDVKGTTTTVESKNTTVADNILQLNFGSTGSGISSALGYQSGIEIERGTAPAAQFLFSEQFTHYDTVGNSSVSGTFVLQTHNNSSNTTTLSGLRLRTLTNDGSADLGFDLQSSSTAVLRIVNSPNYASLLSDPNDIPNLAYVNNYVSTAFLTTGVAQIQYPVSGASVLSEIRATGDGGGSLFFYINGTQEAQITSAGFQAGNITINGDTIQDTSGSNNLIIRATNGNVNINSILGLVNQTAPTASAGVTKLYSNSTVGPGGSGVYFTSTTVSPVPDELISRHRAVIYSILL